MIVQIAGITNEKEAIDCANEGVDIIGLLVGQMHNSNEFISQEKAKQIKDALPENLKTTLITHLLDGEKIASIAKYIGVDYVQLHSTIAEKEVKKIRDKLPNVKLIRLIHVSEKGEILSDYKKFKYVDFYFTDSINTATNQVGGTGLTHNLKTDKMLRQTLDKPLFIAGGLTPENVADAIKYVKPYAVDVNSGCRAKKGGRDMKKVRKFVQNAKK